MTHTREDIDAAIEDITHADDGENIYDNEFDCFIISADFEPIIKKALSVYKAVKEDIDNGLVMVPSIILNELYTDVLHEGKKSKYKTAIAAESAAFKDYSDKLIEIKTWIFDVTQSLRDRIFELEKEVKRLKGDNNANR